MFLDNVKTYLRSKPEIALRLRCRTKPGLEAIYFDLFKRELAKKGIEDDFFPVGSAANCSLLYLILRTMNELPPAKVLELGAGQSTILLNRLLGERAHSDLVTLEHDPMWAGIIGSRTGNRIEPHPLVKLNGAGHGALGYPPSAIEGQRFQLIIVDGPIGVSRYSRAGIVDLIEAGCLDRDFGIIFDDADRFGEQDTMASVQRLLKKRGLDFLTGCVKAARVQFVIAGGRMRPMAYF